MIQLRSFSGKSRGEMPRSSTTDCSSARRAEEKEKIIAAKVIFVTRLRLVLAYKLSEKLSFYAHRAISSGVPACKKHLPFFYRAMRIIADRSSVAKIGRYNRATLRQVNRHHARHQ